MSDWKAQFAPIGTILSRIGYVLILWTICRIGFYMSNRSILPTPMGSEWLVGIRFDLVSVLYINSLWIFLSLITSWLQLRVDGLLKGCFVFTNSLFLLVEIVDMGYFRFANRRMTISDFSLFKNNIFMIPSMMKEYWYLSLIILLFVWSISRLHDSIKTTNTPIPFRILPQIIILILTIGLFITGARGGWQLRPLTPLNAADDAHDLRLMPFISNTTLNLIFATQQRALIIPNYMPDSTAQRVYPIFLTPSRGDSMRRYNVVVIALESFGKEYSGRYTPEFRGQYSGYTPFLDSLASVSYSCAMSYANGLRSTQGIVALSAGLPALMDDPFMFSAYQSNRLDGLARLLKQKGYTTAFLHLARKGSMDFDKFATLTGFERFYEQSMYKDPSKYDGQWGIWDEQMFQFMSDSLDKMPQPFYTFCFTLTSHHPYKVPDFFERQYPQVPKLYRSILYSDWALRRFFERAAQSAWFANTLFVIAADHTGASSAIDAYQTHVGRYKIPILFYKPNEILPKEAPKVCQQIDVIPSVLDFLKYDQPYLSFGRSVWSSNEGLAFQYESSLYQIINKKYVLFFDGQQIQRVHELEKDPLLQTDVQHQAQVPTDSLGQILKAVIQQHHKAMILNQLYQ